MQAFSHLQCFLWWQQEGQRVGVLRGCFQTLTAGLLSQIYRLSRVRRDQKDHQVQLLDVHMDLFVLSSEIQGHLSP